MKFKTEIFREFCFEATHRLPHVPVGHKCGRLHGHTFQVIVHVSGEVDKKYGWIMDFGEIETAFASVMELLDHRYLNEIDGLENPTSENLAAFIIVRLRLPNNQVSAVTVKENCTAGATVYANYES